jgi:hypothetical protein
LRARACADVLVVVITMVSLTIMIIMPSIGTQLLFQPLPARGADDHSSETSLHASGTVA